MTEDQCTAAEAAATKAADFIKDIVRSRPLIVFHENQLNDWQNACEFHGYLALIEYFADNRMGRIPRAPPCPD